MAAVEEREKHPLSGEEQQQLFSSKVLEIMNWLEEKGTLPKVKKIIADRFFGAQDGLEDKLDKRGRKINSVLVGHHMRDNANYHIRRREIDDNDSPRTTRYDIVFDDGIVKESVGVGRDILEPKIKRAEPFFSRGFRTVDLAFLKVGVSALDELQQDQLPNLKPDLASIDLKAA